MVIEMTFRIELDADEVAIIGAMLAKEAGRYVFKLGQKDEDRITAKVLTELGHKVLSQAIAQSEENKKNEN